MNSSTETIQYASVPHGFACLVPIPGDVDLKGQVSENTVYICVDVSGSMSGSPLQQAKAATLSLIKELRQCRIEDIVVVFWDDRVSPYPVKGLSDEIITGHFNSVRARGGTSFTTCLTWVQGHIAVNSSPKTNTVLFLTDGQDHRFSGTENQILETLKRLVGSKTCVFHCIGFARDHDVRVLNVIAKGGSSPGTFQYAESSDKIDTCVKNLVEVLSGKVYKCTIQHVGEETSQAFFDADGFARVHLKPKDVQAGRLTVAFGDTITTRTLEPVNDGHKVAVSLAIWNAQGELERLADKVFVPTPGKKVIDQCTNDIIAMQENIQNIVKKAYRVDKGDRANLVSRCMELTALVDALRARAALAITGSLKDSQIAEWRDLASRPRLANRRANKELDKRAINNSAILEEALANIKAIAEKADYSNVTVKTDVQENCVCLYTLNRPLDALREGDCMALTLQVRRSEAAIFDPNQLAIDAIGTSFMTCDTFFETSALAKRYAASDSVEVPLKGEAENVGSGLTKSGKDKDKATDSWSGGFDKNVAGSLIKGVGAENINGIVPLFLFNEHWQVAKIKMKPVLGYMCTLDVTGYTGSQTTIVPFLVLYKALQDVSARDDAHNQFIFRIVLETCMAIYKPRTDFREELKKRYETYLATPAGRVTDVVPRTCTFLMHLYVALLCDDISLDTFQRNALPFCHAVADETIRRAVRNLETLPDLVSLYNIDRQRDITSAVDVYEKELTGSKNEISNAGLAFKMAALAFNANSNTESKGEDGSTAANNIGAAAASSDVPQMPQHAYKADSKKISATALKFVSLITNTVGTQLRVGGLSAIRTMGKLNLDLSVETILGALPPLVKLAIAVQSWEQRKQQDRLRAAESGDYVNFFAPDGNEKAIVFIEKRADRVIREERQAEINKILSVRSSSAANAAAFSFAGTADLDEAAGLIMQDCAYIGRKSHGAFLSMFQTTNNQRSSMGTRDIPLAVQKLRMFILGEYRGVVLRVDRQQKSTSPRWKPSKKNMFRIWLTYRNVADAKLFTDIFPDNIHQIEKWTSIENDGKRIFPQGLSF